MEKVVIKKMESEAEIQGKGYVHYKSWHETYTDLIDADYLERFTLEKCIATAHKWPNNILVAKDGEWVVGILDSDRLDYTLLKEQLVSLSNSTPAYFIYFAPNADDTNVEELSNDLMEKISTAIAEKVQERYDELFPEDK